MLEITVDASQVVAASERKLSLVTEAMRNKLNAVNIDLQNYIVTEKLQGDPLQQRRGGRGLAGSIRMQPAEVEGDVVSGEVEGGGGTTFYGKYHEYGGTFDVPEHERRSGFTKEGERTALLTKTGMTRKNVFLVETGMVKAHTITFPVRSFMRSSLDENREQIIAGLRETLMGVMAS